MGRKPILFNEFGLKVCTGCGEEKRRDEYSKQAASPSGHQPMCKQCHVKKTQSYQPPEVKARSTRRAATVILEQFSDQMDEEERLALTEVLDYTERFLRGEIRGNFEPLWRMPDKEIKKWAQDVINKLQEIEYPLFPSNVRKILELDPDIILPNIPGGVLISGYGLTSREVDRALAMKEIAEQLLEEEE